MKKFCVTTLLTFVTLQAATVTNNDARKSEPAVPLHVAGIMEAARTVKNIAVNIQHIDPKNMTLKDGSTVVVPEPATNMLIGGALVGLALLSRRRKRT